MLTDPDPTVRIHGLPSDNHYFAGYNLTLSCFIDISNYSHIFDQVIVVATWFKDGVECNINWESRISVRPVALSGNGIYITTLSFKPLISGDSANYQCTANLIGSAGTSVANNTVSTTLVVEGMNNYFMTVNYSYNCIYFL